MILTDVIDFSNQYQLLYLKQIQDLLDDYHQEILFVELETSLEERLCRNRTENRLKHKPLKRHIEVSEREILETAETLQLNSQYQPNELHHYFKINNTNLSAEEVAKQIQNKMNTIEKGQTHV
ncbi:shikimate kinase [Streptococcus oralis]|uniref:Shikimate kinase n=1 Tax=Streptococcus oralis TaxID=1303 RepID=A0A081R7C3_STROR|nr:shikimate kinase [Streptococcus oralis]